MARWMHTGDLAVMHDSGYVNISGRLKDLIIRAARTSTRARSRNSAHAPEGQRSASGRRARSQSTVKKCARGFPTARRPDGNGRGDPGLRRPIATCKIPRYVRFTTEFPTTVTGKIQFRMRQVSIEELGLSRADAVKTA